MNMICKLCGAEENCRYTPETKKQLEERQLCFSCNFWQNIVNRGTQPNCVIIDGNHFWISKDEPQTPTNWLGFGGRKFTIRFNDGRVVTTQNMWHEGSIPQHFREQLPDNATWEKSDLPKTYKG
jgi:hypothetical protein